MATVDTIRDVAEELYGLAADLHDLRLDIMRESDLGHGSAWHTELEARLAELVGDADYCHSVVDNLAWNIELTGIEDDVDEDDGDKDGDEDEAEVFVTDTCAVPAIPDPPV
jgi:hypothetical protein